MIDEPVLPGEIGLQSVVAGPDPLVAVRTDDYAALAGGRPQVDALIVDERPGGAGRAPNLHLVAAVRTVAAAAVRVEEVVVAASFDNETALHSAALCDLTSLAHSSGGIGVHPCHTNGVVASPVQPASAIGVGEQRLVDVGGRATGRARQDRTIVGPRTRGRRRGGQADGLAARHGIVQMVETVHVSDIRGPKPGSALPGRPRLRREDLPRVLPVDHVSGAQDRKDALAVLALGLRDLTLCAVGIPEPVLAPNDRGIRERVDRAGRHGIRVGARTCRVDGGRRAGDERQAH